MTSASSTGKKVGIDFVVITIDDIRSMKILTSEQRTNIQKLKYEHKKGAYNTADWNKVIRYCVDPKTNQKYISPYEVCGLKSFIPDLKLFEDETIKKFLLAQKELEKPIFANPLKKTLILARELHHLYRVYVTLGIKLESNPDYPLLLIIPFFAIEGFYLAYAAYVETNQDNCFIDRPSGEKDVDPTTKTSVSKTSDTHQEYLRYMDSLKPIPAAHSEEVLLFQAVISALTMVRRFAKKEHLSQVLKNRSNTFGNLVGNCIAVNETNCEDCIDVDSIKNASIHMSSYPYLKSAVFRAIVNYDSSGLTIASLTASHIKDLARLSQMTMFSLIRRFVYSQNKLKAHANATVFVEMYRWNTVFVDISRKLSTNWEFLKLLDPLDQTIAMKQWGNLAALAYYWSIETVDSTLDKMYTDFKVTVNVVDLLSHSIPLEFIKPFEYDSEDEAAFDAIMNDEEFIKIWGINAKSRTELQKIELASIFNQEVADAYRRRIDTHAATMASLRGPSREN